MNIQSIITMNKEITIDIVNDFGQSACINCPNNPKNGGNGIYNCILGQ